MNRVRVVSFVLMPTLLLGGCASTAMNPGIDEFVIRAKLLEAQGRDEEAALTWLKTTEIRRDYVPGYINAAETYQKVGKFRSSLAVSETAKRVASTRPEPLFLSGKAKFAMSDYAGALEEWRLLKETEPSIAEFHRLVGEAEEAQKNWTPALAAYRDAATVDRANPQLFLAIARVHAQAGNIAAALDNLEHALSAGLNPWLIVEDVRLASVRDHPNFRAILSRLPVAASAEKESPLFARLGGFRALHIIGEGVARGAVQDPRLNKSEIAGIEKKIVAEVCEASRGPCKDFVDAAANTKVKLSNDQFQALMEDLKKNLVRFRVTETTRDQLLNAVASSRHEFTGD